MRICATMIVKNEAHVLRRCLESVLPLIDCICVCDTGSTDDTERVFWDVVENQCVEAEYVHHAWENFGANRTQAFRAAERLHNLGRGDWHLVIDADDTLEREARLSFQEIARAMIGYRPEVDGWKLEVLHSGTHYHRGHLFRADGCWQYKWPLHECAFRAGAITEHLPGLRIRFGGDGARSQMGQREKYLADADICRAYLAEHPEDTRMAFYLAQSLKDAGEFDAAIEAYRHRAKMQGWQQEAYYALLQEGRLLQMRGNSPKDSYLEAHRRDHTRAEAPFEIAKYLADKLDHPAYRVHRWRMLEEAYLWAEMAATRPDPTRDHLFVEPDVWEWSRNLAAQLRGRL